MTGCTQAAFDFPALKRRKVQAEFSGGDITSDGGMLLRREIDRRLGLLEAVDAAIPDPREPPLHRIQSAEPAATASLCFYDDIYCARGDMENRIKEQQLGLFTDRASAHHWWANQFRLLLTSLAYVLMEGIRRLALKGTELARAQMTTIRSMQLLGMVGYCSSLRIVQGCTSVVGTG